MNRVFATPFALLLSAMAFDGYALEPLSYDYVYADLASGTKDETLGRNSDVMDLAVGGYYGLDSTWILTGEYSARFIHLDDTTAQNYILLPGLGMRIGLGERLDLLVDGKLGGIRYVLSDDDSDDDIESSTKLMYGASARLRYALTENWQLGAGLRLRRSDIVDEDIMDVGVHYRFNSLFALGGFYTHTEYSHHSSNSGGLSLRVYY